MCDISARQFSPPRRPETVAPTAPRCGAASQRRCHPRLNPPICAKVERKPKIKLKQPVTVLEKWLRVGPAGLPPNSGYYRLPQVKRRRRRLHYILDAAKERAAAGGQSDALQQLR